MKFYPLFPLLMTPTLRSSCTRVFALCPRPEPVAALKTLAPAGVAGAAFASVVPGKSFAASGNYQAMLVNCIDPRFTHPQLAIHGVRSQGVSRDKLERDNCTATPATAGVPDRARVHFRVCQPACLTDWDDSGHHRVFAPHQTRDRHYPPRLRCGQIGFSAPKPCLIKTKKPIAHGILRLCSASK
jgi:hypothetical protein